MVLDAKTSANDDELDVTVVGWDHAALFTGAALGTKSGKASWIGKRWRLST